MQFGGNFSVAHNTGRLFKVLLSKSVCNLLDYEKLMMMLNTLVLFQMTRFTKSFIADITFVRFLVRVRTLVPLKSTRITETFSRKHHTRIHTASRW